MADSIAVVDSAFVTARCSRCGVALSEWGESVYSAVAAAYLENKRGR